MKRSFRKAGFTLLEVLMVVAMLAIVGGAIITSYGGLEDKAAKGTATHTIAAVTEAFLVYQSTEGGLPNNLETLAAATPTAPAYQAAELDNSADAVTGEVLAGNLRPDKLPGKFGMNEAAPSHIAALKAAGITKIRYMDLKGNDETVADLDIKAADGTDATAVGALSGISIPQHAFEAPRPGNGRNRGRGFYGYKNQRGRFRSAGAYFNPNQNQQHQGNWNSNNNQQQQSGSGESEFLIVRV